MLLGCLQPPLTKLSRKEMASTYTTLFYLPLKPPSDFLLIHLKSISRGLLTMIRPFFLTKSKNIF